MLNRHVDYLKQLFKESQKLKNGDHESCESLRTSAYSTICSLFGEESVYAKQLGKYMNGAAGAFIEKYRAILHSSLRDIENGALEKYELYIYLNSFEDFLKQAKQLNNGGNEGKKPAGVLVSAVFEDFLSRLCKTNGENPPDSAKSKIDLLKSKSILNTIESSRMETIKELRNKAMHAKWDDYDNSDVGKAISDLEDILSTKFGN
ncbi:MAG: hypothetical protein JXR46_02410 [Calditrichaceae bacterium]|nr:hypothetical protein [Calditrichaceae bacterium]MBN2707875.1 hypothetical protein [Calditrichaceae bacterium]RQV94245.1 MAG: DUF4145 domain-containing protein [Calditrichota bacterium]